MGPEGLDNAAKAIDYALEETDDSFTRYCLKVLKKPFKTLKICQPKRLKDIFFQVWGLFYKGFEGP